MEWACEKPVAPLRLPRLFNVAVACKNTSSQQFQCHKMLGAKRATKNKAPFSKSYGKKD